MKMHLNNFTVTMDTDFPYRWKIQDSYEIETLANFELNPSKVGSVIPSDNCLKITINDGKTIRVYSNGKTTIH